MENSVTEENPSMFSKTLFEKIKFVKAFEADQNQTISSDQNTNLSKTQSKVATPTEEMESTISKKYADHFVSSSHWFPHENFVSSSEVLSGEKSDFFISLKKYENATIKDSISIQNIRVFFQEIGIFNENLSKNETQEADFIWNLFGTLNLPQINQDFVSLNMLFQVLHILYQDKLQINRSAQLIQVLIENRLKKFNILEDFNLFREARGFWSLEKLIMEFRKLMGIEKTNVNFLDAEDKKKKKSPRNENKKNQTQMDSEILKKDKKYYKNRYEMLFQHAKYLKDKKEMTHALKYIQDLHQFSFKPQIKRSPKKENKSLINKPLPKDPIKIIKIQNQDVWIDECFNRLYVNSKIKKERKEKYSEINKKSEKEDSTCTFKPSINKYNKLYSSNNDNNYNVKGFEENIKRIAEARVEKVKILKLYEEPLLRFPKNKKYIESRETNYTVPKPFNLKNSQENENLDILMFVDVDVGHGKIGRVGIHQGENVDEIAKNFAKVYTLNKEMERKLVNNLKLKVECYYRSFKYNLNYRKIP